MRGFWPLAAFELRLHLRRISTWVYFGVFLLLGFFLTAAAAGAWPDFDTGDPLRVANAPVRVARTLLTLGLLGVPVTLGVVGGAVHRDFQTGIYPLFFSTPLSPARYLGGRYAGAVLANLAMLLGAPLGMALAAASPWVDPARVHPFQPLAYLHPLLLLVVPNLLVTGALFLVLAAHTRRMLAVYAGAMGLLLAYGVSLLAMQALEADWLTWALDPFGLVPALRATRYWTVVEQNRDYLPAAGPLLWNRALWLGIGAAVLAAGMVRFRFAHYADERLDARGEAAAEERPVAPHELARRLSVPPAARSFSARARWAQLCGELRRSLHEVMGNVYFPIIVGCCLAFVLAAAAGMGEMYGTRTYPVTWQVLELLFGTFFLFVVGVITFYAGELVWHEREVGTAQLHDSAPVPTWLPLAAKVAALTAVVLALLAAAMGVGILIQLSRGYYRFEPGLYLRELFLHQLSFYFPLLVLAIAIQTVVVHKYLGHFLMLLYYVGSPVLYLLGLEHNLFHYAASPDVVYSDMNGYGPGWVPVFWYGLLWALAALLLAVGTHLFWVRGQETAGRARLRLARLRLTRPLLAVAGAAGVLVAATAGFIGYNTAVLNDWETS
ncbi:MAG TPA: hypothetical protein VFX98_17760, partial [Longimicrobiaceae bacterium]|nr:hypothetical protein [Longimicrobiaceae bacterium]